MSVESILSICASLIAIGGVVITVYNRYKNKSLITLMTELADKNTPLKRQQKILAKINKQLKMRSQHISSAYIKSFHANGRSKLAIFYDMCNENDIEPTTEICNLLLGNDEKKFRNEWTARHLKTITDANATETSPEAILPKSSTVAKDGEEIV